MLHRNDILSAVLNKETEIGLQHLLRQQICECRLHIFGFQTRQQPLLQGPGEENHVLHPYIREVLIGDLLYVYPARIRVFLDFFGSDIIGFS